MRVLLLSEGDPETKRSWSGISKSLVDELRASGHEVLTADCELTGIARYLAAARCFSPDRQRWRSRFRLGGSAFDARSRKAERAIATAGPDIDFILQTGATFVPRRKGNIPYAVYCDSNIRVAAQGRATGHSQATPLNERELQSVIDREVSVYRDASAIFTISEQLRRSFIDDFGIPASRVHTVFAGPNMDVSGLPEQTTPTSGPRRVLFVGRQFERKGGDILLRAFERVREEVPDAELWVIGPDDEAIGSRPGVTLLGFVDTGTTEGRRDIEAAYAAADVFCLPTRFEPFGIAFVEAMHFGLPCVGTDAWAVPEIISDGRTGFTVPPNHVELLADRLIDLLTGPQLAASMGAAGRAKAQQYFTWEAVVNRITEIASAFTGPRPL